MLAAGSLATISKLAIGAGQLVRWLLQPIVLMMCSSRVYHKVSTVFALNERRPRKGHYPEA